MPFPAAPKAQFQGNRPPVPGTLPYPIIAARGTVIATSLLPTASAVMMMAGHKVTASLQQTGTMPGPGGGAYPRVTVDTYVFQRNGAAGDALGATLSNLQSHPLGIPMIFRIEVRDPANQLVGQMIAMQVKFV